MRILTEEDTIRELREVDEKIKNSRCQKYRFPLQKRRSRLLEWLGDNVEEYFGKTTAFIAIKLGTGGGTNINRKKEEKKEK